MLADPVRLHDVHDAEAFVQATINRSRILLSVDERDELVLTGLEIMCSLARGFEPHRAGYLEAGRFSGYAAQFLPRKLGDAWHRMHPEHQLITQPDGRRRWIYGEKHVSLEAFTQDDPDRQPLLAAAGRGDDILARTARALDARWQRRRKTILSVAEVFSEGGNAADAAEILGLTTAQVWDSAGELRLVAERLESEEA